MEERFDELFVNDQTETWKMDFVSDPDDIQILRMIRFIRSEKELSARETEERVLRELYLKILSKSYIAGMPEQHGGIFVYRNMRDDIKNYADSKGINLTSHNASQE